VTNHPKLQLVVMTPWNLEIARPGEAVLNHAEQEVGLGKVEFHLTDLTARARRATRRSPVREGGDPGRIRTREEIAQVREIKAVGFVGSCPAFVPLLERGPDSTVWGMCPMQNIDDRPMRPEGCVV
jgi:hypothetical protein